MQRLFAPHRLKASRTRRLRRHFLAGRYRHPSMKEAEPLSGPASIRLPHVLSSTPASGPLREMPATDGIPINWSLPHDSAQIPGKVKTFRQAPESGVDYRERPSPIKVPKAGEWSDGEVPFATRTEDARHAPRRRRQRAPKPTAVPAAIWKL